MTLNQIPDVDISKLEQVCVWPELCSSWFFLQKQGTGFPRATVETELTQCGEKSREQLESKLHPGDPQEPRGTCTKGPMSLKNGASHPELGQSTAPPAWFPSLET